MTRTKMSQEQVVRELLEQLDETYFASREQARAALDRLPNKEQFTILANTAQDYFWIAPLVGSGKLPKS